MIRARLLAASCLAAFVALTPAARAQPPTSDIRSQEAATHFERGVKLYEEQDWRGALIEFERAYGIAPRYAVLFNIAQARYQLLDYAGTLDAFQRYLVEGGDALTPARSAQVQASITELRGRVARLTVTTNVAGAEITIDDAPVGVTPLAGPLVVSAGRRKVVALKPGRVNAVRFVDIAGGDTADIILELHEVPATHARQPTAVAPTAERRSLVPAVLGLGVAAAGIGVGSVFGVFAMGDKHDLDRACPNKACPPSSQSQVDALSGDSLVSTIAFGVGAAGLVVGVGWLALRGGGGEARANAARVEPWIGPTSAGVRGAF
jgi:hypothetical protein